MLWSWQPDSLWQKHTQYDAFFVICIFCILFCSTVVLTVPSTPGDHAQTVTSEMKDESGAVVAVTSVEWTFRVKDTKKKA